MPNLSDRVAHFTRLHKEAHQRRELSRHVAQLITLHKQDENATFLTIARNHPDTGHGEHHDEQQVLGEMLRQLTRRGHRSAQPNYEPLELVTRLEKEHDLAHIEQELAKAKELLLKRKKVGFAGRVPPPMPHDYHTNPEAKRRHDTQVNEARGAHHDFTHGGDHAHDHEDHLHHLH